MPETLVGYKMELIRRQKKIKDLAREMPDLSYSQVSRILNGFDYEPIWFNRRVNEILKKWDVEKGEEK